MFRLLKHSDELDIKTPTLLGDTTLLRGEGTAPSAPPPLVTALEPILYYSVKDDYPLSQPSSVSLGGNRVGGEVWMTPSVATRALGANVTRSATI